MIKTNKRQVIIVFRRWQIESPLDTTGVLYSKVRTDFTVSVKQTIECKVGKKSHLIAYRHFFYHSGIADIVDWQEKAIELQFDDTDTFF